VGLYRGPSWLAGVHLVQGTIEDHAEGHQQVDGAHAEFGALHAIGALPRAVRRIVTAEGLFLALASWLVAVIPTLGLTEVLGAGLGNLFFSAPLPYRISVPAILIWTAVVLGAVPATEAAGSRAARITVREALVYL
jgi:putative ABC transport system permease protein